MRWGTCAMQMSEARIRSLAKKMAREMAMRGAVKSVTSPDAIADVIAKTMIRDQQIEEQIEAEARAMLAKQRNLPPPGTGQYQAAFLQAKKAVAARKGIKL